MKFNGACFTEEESDMILRWSEASLKTSSQVFVFELAVRAILIRHLYDLFTIAMDMSYIADGLAVASFCVHWPLRDQSMEECEDTQLN